MPESPYAHPDPNLRIKKFSHLVPRPTAEQVAKFPEEATALLERIWTRQSELISYGQFDLDWMRGKHFLLAGATGPGLGGALESAARRFTVVDGSVTVLARDLSKSLGFVMGQQMTERAKKAGFEERYHFINKGMDIKGPTLEAIITALHEAGAKEVIYINGIAAAFSGMLPGYPPVYVKDVDKEGLFQYELQPLTDQQIETTRYIMGIMAVEFPRHLEDAGIKVEATCYLDWRGSLDVISRDPESVFYGRQGPYSTSLYLPKQFLKADTIQAYGHGRKVIDCYLPVMRSRAIGFIPGATPQAHIAQKMMDISNVRVRDVPELALGVLDQIGKAVSGGIFNPFPRLDDHEVPLEEWYWQIVQRLTNDEASEFYWKKWVPLEFE